MNRLDIESRLQVSAANSGFPSPMKLAHSASTSSVTRDSSANTGGTIKKGPDPPKWSGRLGVEQNDLKEVECEMRAQLVIVDERIRAILGQKGKQRNLSREVTDSVKVLMVRSERLTQACDHLSAIADATQGKRKKVSLGSSPEPVKLIRKVGTVEGFKEVVSRRKKGTTAAETSGIPKPAGTGTAAKDKSEGITRQDGARPKQRARRVRDSDAVLIKPAEGVMSSDALRPLKESVDPEATHMRIQGYQKTNNGALLVRVRSETENRKAFQEKLQASLGGRGK